MKENWAINIDMLGFSKLWGKEIQIKTSLGELMRGIVKIGRDCYPYSPERLFVYQLGDCFIIANDFPESSLERPIAIAVALIRHVASSGRYAKAAIAEGEIADIRGCYPREIFEEIENDTITLGEGLMLITSVMGTALIRSVKIAESPCCPKGPMLIIEKTKINKIPECIPFKPINDKDLIAIDWVHMKSRLLSEIQQKSSLEAPSPQEIENSLGTYTKNHKLTDKWRSDIENYLNFNII